VKPLSLQGKIRMCGEKRAFGERLAKKEAHRLRLRAYQCPLCYAWHLTKVNADGPR
jgi:hypothetical protein